MIDPVPKKKKGNGNSVFEEKEKLMLNQFEQYSLIGKMKEGTSKSKMKTERARKDMRQPEMQVSKLDSLNKYR